MNTKILILPIVVGVFCAIFFQFILHKKESKFITKIEIAYDLGYEDGYHKATHDFYESNNDLTYND